LFAYRQAAAKPRVDWRADVGGFPAIPGRSETDDEPYQ
jgi:hypothetical protein